MTRHIAGIAQEHVGEGAYWHGRRVYLLEGTTLLLRPEAELAEHYGQPRNQHGLGYWVNIRAVATFRVHTGVLSTVAEGPYGGSEQSLAKATAQLALGDTCVGGSNFGVFSVVQAARHYELGVLFRLTAKGARALAGHTLQPGEDLSVNRAPSKLDQARPEMRRTPIAGRVIYVHLEPKGFRPIGLYFFTTLVDASVDDLVTLYGPRWHAELNLRYVKSTLDMEMLTAKSVDMVRKELRVGLAAYNVVRLYMAMAARQVGLAPLALSFTECWRRVLQVVFCLRLACTPDYAERQVPRLLERLAKCRLQRRDRSRVEPRAARRRPAVRPALKGSRDKARALELQRRRAEPAKSQRLWTKGRHTCELKRRHDITLNIDDRQSGLGGASCGPGTLPQYLIEPREMSFTIRLRPLGENDPPPMDLSKQRLETISAGNGAESTAESAETAELTWSARRSWRARR